MNPCPACGNVNCTCGNESDYFDAVEVDEYREQLEFEMVQEANDGE